MEAWLSHQSPVQVAAQDNGNLSGMRYRAYTSGSKGCSTNQTKVQTRRRNGSELSMVASTHPIFSISQSLAVLSGIPITLVS